LLLFRGVNAHAAGEFSWAARFGNTGRDSGVSVASDTSGNVYVTGDFNGTVDFDPGPEIVNLTAVGFGDTFVLKLTESGEFEWVRHFAGPYGQLAASISIDSDGNVVASGSFAGSVDFDPTASHATLSTNGGYSVYVAKLNSAGDLLWVHDMCSDTTTNLFGKSVVDTSNNVYATGYFVGAVDFDPGPGVAYLRTSGVSPATFIVKLDSDGGFLWARQISSGDYTSSATGLSVSTGAGSAVVVAGYFAGTVDFDPGVAVQDRTTTGYNDGFVAKLDSSGGFSWVRTIGGSLAFVRGLSTAVDAAGNIDLIGSFTAAVSVNGESTPLLSSGSDDVFVMQFDHDGNHQWSQQFGSTGSDQSSSIATDNKDNIYAVGRFSGTVDFDPGPASFALTSAGSYDAFAVKMSRQGGLLWAESIGGTGVEHGNGVAHSPGGTIYLAGDFQGTFDVDPGAGTSFVTSVDQEDMFLVALAEPSPEVTHVLRANATPSSASMTIYEVGFSEPVSGVTSDDFDVSASGITGASIADVTGSGETFYITVDTGSGDGTLRLVLLDDDSIVNASVVPLGGPGVGNGDYTMGEAYDIDKTAPSVTMTTTAPDPTNSTPIHVTVAFSESVLGFESNDIDLVNATTNNFAGSGDSYAFDLVPMDQGVVTANIGGSACIDEAGNGNLAATTLSRTYDSEQPTVSMVSSISGPTNTTPIPVTVTFSKSVTGFDEADLVLTNCTVSNLLPSSSSTYSFGLEPTAQGMVGATVSAGAVTSTAGNPNQSGSFSIIFDSQPPAITLLGDNPTMIYEHETYFDAGATAFDAIDGNISSQLVIDMSGVIVSVAGSYQVTYEVSDAAGNSAPQAVRTVVVLQSPPSVPVYSFVLLPAFALVGVLVILKNSHGTR
jgi:hypothetical protein